MRKKKKQASPILTNSEQSPKINSNGKYVLLSAFIRFTWSGLVAGNHMLSSFPPVWITRPYESVELFFQGTKFGRIATVKYLKAKSSTFLSCCSLLENFLLGARPENHQTFSICLNPARSRSRLEFLCSVCALYKQNIWQHLPLAFPSPPCTPRSGWWDLSSSRGRVPRPSHLHMCVHVSPERN